MSDKPGIQIERIFHKLKFIFLPCSEVGLLTVSSFIPLSISASENHAEKTQMVKNAEQLT